MIYYGLSRPSQLNNPEHNCWDLRKNYKDIYQQIMNVRKLMFNEETAFFV